MALAEEERVSLVSASYLRPQIELAESGRLTSEGQFSLDGSRMRKKLCTAAATIVFAAPLMAQSLSVEMSPPIAADLLIHSGSFVAGRSYVDSGHCPKGEAGKRQQVAEVVFDPPYLAIPQVLVALNALDFKIYDETPRNPRVRARAEHVTPEAMTLVVETWCDTNLAEAGGTFLVMGQAGERLSEERLGPPPVVLEEVGPPAASQETPSVLLEDW